jgi:branched-chain amino acid aminotransferase
MEEIVYLNGTLIPRPRAKLSPFDHGFLYSYGLFETMRAYGGKIFRLDRHLARLQQSAKALNIYSKLASFKLAKACHDVLEANKLADARIRLTVSAGEGDITPNPETCTDITVFIVARKLVLPPPEIYQKGFKTILSTGRRNSQSPISHMKSTAYLENVLAKQEARAARADEAIIINERGFVVEGSSSNIFLVQGKALITPCQESGALPGITREAVLELAQSLGIEATEREVELEELVQAEEAFLTSSVMEIMPLTWLEDKPIGTGKPGALTQQLMSAYRKLVEKETLSRAR